MKDRKRGRYRKKTKEERDEMLEEEKESEENVADGKRGEGRYVV